MPSMLEQCKAPRAQGESAAVSRAKIDLPQQRRLATVLLSHLRAESVLAKLASEAPTHMVAADFGEAPVVAASADDVLYLPSRHLQIWRGTTMPAEANTDDDAVSELLEAAQRGEA